MPSLAAVTWYPRSARSETANSRTAGSSSTSRMRSLPPGSESAPVLPVSSLTLLPRRGAGECGKSSPARLRSRPESFRPTAGRCRRPSPEPRPVPCPTGLVVKNGSNRRRRVSASIPEPVSRHRQLDVVSGAQTGHGPASRGLDPARRGGDPHHAALEHRVAGIHDEIHHHLFELRRFGAHHDRSRGERELEVEAFADEATQQVDRDQSAVRSDRGSWGSSGWRRLKARSLPVTRVARSAARRISVSSRA